MSPDISIVIPAHNEESVVNALASAFNVFLASVEFSAQIVFVDDGSTDSTVDALSSCKIDKADVKIVKLSRNFGAHAAIRAGVFHADADHIVVYSMDMPEPIEDIAIFYQKLKEGSEIVYSERLGYRGSLGSRIFATLVNKYILPNYPANGLIGVAFGPKAKRELNTNVENNSSFFFHLFQLGFSRASFEVEYQERSAGSSKWTFNKKLKLLIDCFVMFSFAPLRLISAIGFLLAAFGFLYALGILIAKVFNLLQFSAGYPTLISVVLIGFGITLLSLGIISEYLVRTLEASRNRPTFIVDEIL